MNKHLSEEDIIKLLDSHLKDSNGAEHYAYETIKREIMDIPGVVIAPWNFEIIEFKHGHWCLADDGDGLVCSECGEDFCNIYLEVERFKYCPNCGACMSIEITEDELFDLYLRRGMDDIMDFNEYKTRMKHVDCVVTSEE